MVLPYAFQPAKLHPVRWLGPLHNRAHLFRVQLHQVLGDEVVQLGSHLHAGGAAAHNDKGQQLLALLWGAGAGERKVSKRREAH